MSGARLEREIVGGEDYEYYPLGQHVVAAPGVCGGVPTFKYTRVDVRHIVPLLHQNVDHQQIVDRFGQQFSIEAVAEVADLLKREGPDFFGREFGLATAIS